MSEPFSQWIAVFLFLLSALWFCLLFEQFWSLATLPGVQSIIRAINRVKWSINVFGLPFHDFGPASSFLLRSWPLGLACSPSAVVSCPAPVSLLSCYASGLSRRVYHVRSFTRLDLLSSRIQKSFYTFYWVGPRQNYCIGLVCQHSFDGVASPQPEFRPAWDHNAPCMPIPHRLQVSWLP